MMCTPIIIDNTSTVFLNMCLACCLLECLEADTSHCNVRVLHNQAMTPELLAAYRQHAPYIFENHTCKASS
jgi:hypothetical protein